MNLKTKKAIQCFESLKEEKESIETCLANSERPEEYTELLDSAIEALPIAEKHGRKLINKLRFMNYLDKPIKYGTSIALGTIGTTMTIGGMIVKDYSSAILGAMTLVYAGTIIWRDNKIPYNLINEIKETETTITEIRSELEEMYSAWNNQVTS